MLLCTYCTPDCSTLIEWMAAITSIVIVFFGGFNVWQYLSVKKSLSIIEKERIRLTGFVQISFYWHFLKQDEPNIIDAFKAISIALDSFQKIKDEEQIKFCKDQISSFEINKKK